MPNGDNFENPENSENSLKLRVAEAILDDVNKGIVRVDTFLMRQIGVRPGDAVEITGKKTTVAIIDRAYPNDLGKKDIRMDGTIRRNAMTAVEDYVIIKKAKVSEAKKIIVGPANEGIIIKASNEIFKQGLLGRPLMKGDLVSLGGAEKRRNTMMNNPQFDVDDIFKDIFDNLHFDSGFNFNFGNFILIVANTDPKNGPVFVTDETEVEYNPKAVVSAERASNLDVSYESIGGLTEEIRKLREMIELPLKHPELFKRLGIEPPKGVLLYGPPGTGKTLLAKAVSNETNAFFITINGPEIMSKYYGQSEQNLRQIFEEAEKNAPSIIFIDEIDAIAPKREESKGEVERRVVAQLLALMDGLKSRGKVIVIAATNIPNSIDPALRRPGRFDRELEIGVPGFKGRHEILKIHTRNMPIENNPEKISPKKDISFLKKQIFALSKLNKNDLAIYLKKYNTKNREEIYDALQKYLLSLLPQTFTSINNDFAVAIINEFLHNISMVKNKGEKEDNKPAKPIASQNSSDSLADNIYNQIVKVMKNDSLIEKMLKTAVKESVLLEMSRLTHGFVGADLAALAKETAMNSIRRLLPQLDFESNEALPRDFLEKIIITKEDFKDALKNVRPSALREVFIEVPNVTWNSVGGLESVKQELVETIEWPIKRSDVFKKFGITPPKGVLLYGPPGTGKTLLAKAVAHETESNFILVNGPEILSKWVGESEKAIREIFKKARQSAPTIVFFDEFDAIAAKRNLSESSGSRVTELVVNQLLTEIDGLESLSEVVVIAATNRPDLIDTALLRPGRFDRIILTPAPDKNGRIEIFKVHTKDMPIASDVDLEKLAELTKGYVGADIESVCREAAIFSIRKDINAKEVNFEAFKKALEKVKASVTKDIEDAYEKMMKKFSSARAEEMKENRPSYYG